MITETNTFSEISELLTYVPDLTEPKYWFVRTDGGKNFDTYYSNNFIGIGWNQITKADLVGMGGSGEAVKRKIAELESLNLETKKGKSAASSILGKLVRFRDLRKDDFVIIPSSNSKEWAIGRIDDDEIFNSAIPIGDCDYMKRRKVRWIRKVDIHEIDSKLVQVIKARHALFDITGYSYFIDNITQRTFYKNGYGHLVLKIRSTDDIKLKEITSLFENIFGLAQQINNRFEFNEDLQNCAVKINVSSPGPVTLRMLNGKTLIVLGVVLSAVFSGRSSSDSVVNQGDKEKLIQLELDMHGALEEIRLANDSLSLQ